MPIAHLKFISGQIKEYDNTNEPRHVISNNVAFWQV